VTEKIQIFTCPPHKDCDHDWSGPTIERERPSGAVESGVTCAKCGTFYGDWMLWNLP
jgi:hypothetical protein